MKKLLSTILVGIALLLFPNLALSQRNATPVERTVLGITLKHYRSIGVPLPKTVNLYVMEQDEINAFAQVNSGVSAVTIGNSIYISNYTAAELRGWNRARLHQKYLSTCNCMDGVVTLLHEAGHLAQFYTNMTLEQYSLRVKYYEGMAEAVAQDQLPNLMVKYFGRNYLQKCWYRCIQQIAYPSYVFYVKRLSRMATHSKINSAKARRWRINHLRA